MIATDPDSFSAFTQARSGAPGLAYPISELLPINLTTPQPGRTFALNPYLTGVQNLFNEGRAAIVANTGTLVTPATKTQINANSVALPDSLYSHFDQTAAWQAIASNLGSGERVGWGGAVADAVEAVNIDSDSMFTCVSTAATRSFSPGRRCLSSTSRPPAPFHRRANPASIRIILGSAQRHSQRRRNQSLRPEAEVVVQRSIQAQAMLASAVAPAGVGGVPIAAVLSTQFR